MNNAPTLEKRVELMVLGAIPREISSSGIPDQYLESVHLRFVSDGVPYVALAHRQHPAFSENTLRLHYAGDYDGGMTYTRARNSTIWIEKRLAAASQFYTAALVLSLAVAAASRPGTRTGVPFSKFDDRDSPLGHSYAITQAAALDTQWLDRLSVAMENRYFSEVRISAHYSKVPEHIVAATSLPKEEVHVIRAGGA